MRQTSLLLLCLLGVNALVAADPPSKPLESFLMLPEPKAMGTVSSKPWADSRKTVLSPARQIAEKPGIKAYPVGEFEKLGISWEKFLQKAQAAAEKRLAGVKPEFKQDDKGKVIYAVYRSEDPTIASLLVAPSLAKIFENIFGPEVWVVVPDRHSLFVFPPDAKVLDEFATDLTARFEEDAFAASEEIFALKGDGTQQKVIGTFTGR
jgi:hypothetical protein